MSEKSSLFARATVVGDIPARQPAAYDYGYFWKIPLSTPVNSLRWQAYEEILCRDWRRAFRGGGE